MRRPRGTPATPVNAPSRGTRVGAMATLLPLAVSMLPTAGSVVNNLRGPSAAPPAATATASTSRRQPAAKEFSIPIDDLRRWASTVVVTMPEVTIDGNSRVHRQDADCELHFGAHAAGFRGEPPGLVLEPMNACVKAFPGEDEPRDSDWINFANRIRNTVVTISGVPRIWPEHLTGGGEPSNPNHAVEFHPLTSVVTNGETFDFSAHVFAGEYEGGVREQTAESIVRQTTVTVTANGNLADISFFGGRIGNFTTLNLNVDRNSIVSDGVGSFRMNGEVMLEDGTTVPVRMVTVSGSPINDAIGNLRRRRSAMVSLGDTLVLFSLSPEMLVNAVNQSNGNPIAVANPLQLILYGAPDA
jgi:hypothetical protein